MMCKNGYDNCGLANTVFCEECKSNKKVDEIMDKISTLENDINKSKHELNNTNKAELVQILNNILGGINNAI